VHILVAILQLLLDYNVKDFGTEGSKFVELKINKKGAQAICDDGILDLLLA